MSGRGPVGVGIIGAGVISDQYLGNLTRFRRAPPQIWSQSKLPPAAQTRPSIAWK